VDRALAAALRAALSSEIVAARPVSGGDINRAYDIELGDGRRLFAKANARSPRGMFAAEARGLAWLAEAGALRIPQVVAVAAPEAAEQFLVLELVETGSPVSDFDARLGRGLAALHRHGAAGFGLDHDNFVGSLPQSNASAPSWPEFYRRSSTARGGSSRSCAAPPTRGSPARACGPASTGCFARSTTSAVRPSRRPACTAICGAATCCATTRARRASSIRPSTAATARSIWR
jgi:hypothetical protein